MTTHNTCGQTGRARAVRRELFGTNCLYGPCWTTDSLAQGMPKPSWIGENSVAIFFETLLPAALDTRRRSVLPTAIGLMPPSFLASAHKDAPQKTGWISTGTWPLRHMLANSVSRATSRWPASPADLVRSFKCWGRRPSGPPADPGKNALMANNMSDSWRAMDEWVWSWRLRIRGGTRRVFGAQYRCRDVIKRSYCVVASRETNRPSNITIFKFAGNSGRQVIDRLPELRFLLQRLNKQESRRSFGMYQCLRTE